MNFKDFLEIENMTLAEWIQKNSTLLEASSSSRYSVDVNYRTKIREVVESFAKIALGYVSAGLKQNGYHVKHVYEEQPLRILISSRNWDDGEWVGVVHFHPDHDGGSFICSKGFYNKDRRTVSIQKSTKCEGDSPAEIVKEMRNLMHNLKSTPDRHLEKLKPLPMKRGPRKSGKY